MHKKLILLVIMAAAVVIAVTAVYYFKPANSSQPIPDKTVKVDTSTTYSMNGTVTAVRNNVVYITLPDNETKKSFVTSRDTVIAEPGAGNTTATTSALQKLKIGSKVTVYTFFDPKVTQQPIAQKVEILK